jgi:hypothetical protein
MLLGAVLGWAATGAAVQGPPAVQEKENDREKIEQDRPTRRTDRRWIGPVKKGECRIEDAEWEAKSLLELLELALGQKGNIADRKLRDTLERVCVYSVHPGVLEPSPEPPLPPGVKAKPDRMAVATMTNGLTGEIAERGWRVLADHFVDQVGQVRLDRTATPRARLVFIDSHPTYQGPPARPLPGSSWHGYTMARLAYEIVCGGSAPCPVQFATRLALRYDNYDPDMELHSPGAGAENDGGGNWGTVLDLAMAILEEVVYWESTEPGTKLVLNLSVGWDGEFDEELRARKASKLDFAAQAVYEALRFARRRGALVIAAAGNRRGGRPETEWPILPAAWELRRPTWLPFGRGPVYAVGGVDWQGLPLVNSRHRAKPRRAAYADHAVVKAVEPAPAGTLEPAREGPTMMYTGTSVSSAVASSIAAVLWQLRPELRPAEVRRRMERSADLLDSRADFFAWRGLSPPLPRPRIRRLSLCRSVLDACAPDGGRCPALEAVRCQLWSHPPADLSSITLAEMTTSFTPDSPPSDCESSTLFRPTVPGISPTAENVCPMEVVQDLRNPGLLGPQPGENPCPTCTAVPDPPETASVTASATEPGYALLVYIDPNWYAPATAATINSAVLVIHCAGSERPWSFDISNRILPPSGSSTRLILGPIDGRESLRGCTASVDFNVTVGGLNRSVQSPVYVDP